MAKIQVRGAIIPNDYKWYYDLFGMESTAPKDVQDVIDAAGGEELEVYINSGGGSVEAGSEIYTALKSYRGSVKIYITGIAHSAASVIAMAGYSEMSPTALMMVHCVSMGVSGNHKDMRKGAEILETADEALCSAYMEKAGMGKEDALAMMEQETWLTAEQAKERGMVDAVMFEGSSSQGVKMVAGAFGLPTEEQMENARRLAGKKGKQQKKERMQAELDLLILGGKKDGL